MDVAKNDVQGQVLDMSTGLPVPDALIVQTISRGGFWSTPATYDLGHAISENDGTFRIPATPQRLLNASDPDAQLQFGVFAMGYNPAWIFLSEMCNPSLRRSELVDRMRWLLATSLPIPVPLCLIPGPRAS